MIKPSRLLRRAREINSLLLVCFIVCSPVPLSLGVTEIVESVVSLPSVIVTLKLGIAPDAP